MEPLTTVGAGLAVLGSKEILTKLLGPTADYLGEGIKNKVEKGNENIGSILLRAKEILGNEIDKEGKVPPRILKNIINDGFFCDEKICQEYYAGILSASRSEKNDSGIFYTNLVPRLSSRAMSAHYYFYSCALLYGKKVQDKDELSNSFVIDSDDFYNLFGGIEKLSTNEINETLSNLISEDLLSGYGILDKEKLKKDYYPKITEDDCFFFRTTSKGRYFFLWANGLSDTEWYEAKEKCRFFPKHLELKKPLYCKNIFSIGDAYASVD